VTTQPSAKERVFAIRNAIVPIFDGSPIAKVHEAAVDMHDIARSCMKIATAVTELEQAGGGGSDEIRAKMIRLGIELSGELCGHVATLLEFLRSTGLDIDE
jgi:hypothetical protein